MDLTQIKQNLCLLCKYEWIGKKDAKQCPKCKRYDWNVKKGDKNGKVKIK